MFPFGILKIFLPRNFLLIKCMNFIAESWLETNHRFYSLTRKLDIEMLGTDDLSMEEWYLCIANHQSWVDILAIQIAFSKKIPFVKFFLKKELIYIPVIGMAWWAMDFPFMSRYSKETLKEKARSKR